MSLSICRFPRQMMLHLTVTMISMISGTVFADALQRIESGKLEAVRQSVLSLKEKRRVIERAGPYQEYRANLHVHSKWSHDSRGEISDIVSAARAAGTRILMFTEHPADHYDFFKDGHRGIVDDVLLIPGAEMRGFLAYPTISLKGLDPETPQELSDLVTGRDGHTFVSHLEERMDWEIQGVTGTEIYNTHADFKDEKRMIAALKNPFRMMQLAGMIQAYPQECFSALQNYPADYLKRWDELCLKSPHTGVSANDSHQNVGLAIRWKEGDAGLIEDALGETSLPVSLAAIPNSSEWKEGKKPGDIIYRIQLDPYENSLRHVGTHLLMTEFSEKGVREALSSRRAFVAFDWMADSTGFDFAAVNADTRFEMGSQLEAGSDLRFRARAPHFVHWRLVRNGTVVQEHDGTDWEFDASASGPGVYRVEAFLEIAGEQMLWILSNPIYVTGLAASAPDAVK